MLKKMLYIHVLPVDALAANSVQVLSMCQAFCELGVDVTLAVPKGAVDHSESEYKKVIENKMGEYPQFSIVTFRQRTLFGRFKLFASYVPARRLLTDLKPDLVFLRNIVLVDAAIRKNVPFIYESHNSLMHETSGFLNYLWTKYIVRASSNSLMKKFVAISGALGDFWADKGIPREKILSVHDGFDAKKFQVPMERELARTSLGLPSAAKTVLYVGSLYRDRGIEDIIYLASKLPDTLFLIVGGPELEKSNYQDEAARKNLSNIQFLGSVEHRLVPTYLYSSDILLMTWSEAVKTIDYCSPLKLFEYMAAGRVIVGHGFPTIREVLIDGEDAYLVNPGSKTDLLEKMEMALKDDCSLFGERARRKAFSEYTWTRRAQRILDSVGWQQAD